MGGWVGGWEVVGREEVGCVPWLGAWAGWWRRARSVASLCLVSRPRQSCRASLQPKIPRRHNNEPLSRMAGNANGANTTPALLVQ